MHDQKSEHQAGAESWSPSRPRAKGLRHNSSGLRPRRPRVASGLCLLAGWTLLLLAGCSGPRPTFDISFWLDDAGVFKVYARGAHIYVSSPSLDQDGALTWRLKSIEADLHNAADRRIGRQSSTSTWVARDDSQVTSTALVRSLSPSPFAVPWLCHEARSNSKTGLFAHVTHVRRVFTWGGNAPRRPPGNQNPAGTEVRVPFGATYYFQPQAGVAPGGDEPRTTAWTECRQASLCPEGTRSESRS